MPEKNIECEKCGHGSVEYYCDYCGKKIDIVAVGITFGYSSEKDGEDQIFCSDECFFHWVNTKFRKIVGE